MVDGLLGAFLYGVVIEVAVETEPGGFSGLARNIQGKKFGFGQPGRAPPEVALDLNPLANRLVRAEEQKGIASNFNILLRAGMLSRSYEIVKAHAKATGQLQRFYDADCSRYAFVARNTLSHGDGTTITDWPGGLRKNGILEVTWRGRRLSCDDIGKDLPLSNPDAVLLRDDLRALLMALD